MHIRITEIVLEIKNNNCHNKANVLETSAKTTLTCKMNLLSGM